MQRRHFELIAAVLFSTKGWYSDAAYARLVEHWSDKLALINDHFNPAMFRAASRGE